MVRRGVGATCAAVVAVCSIACVSEDARFVSSSTAGAGAHGGSGAQGGDGGATATGGSVGGSSSGGTGAGSALPHAEWAQKFGSANTQPDLVGAARTTDGIFVAGDFTSDVDFGSGPQFSNGGTDLFVAKYDPTGKLVDATTYGDASDATTQVVAGNGTVLAVAGVYEGSPSFGGLPLVSASSSPYAFAAVYGGAGGPVWSKGFPATSLGTYPEPNIWAAAVDGAGQIALTGSFDETVDFGGGALTATGASDAFVVKLGATGTQLWQKSLSADVDSTAVGRGAGLSPAGNVLYVAGEFYGTVDLGGEVLTSPPAAAGDVFVGALDASDGMALWGRRWVVQGNALVSAAAADPTGGFVVVGETYVGVMDFGEGSKPVDSDLYVAKLDEGGALSWVALFTTKDAARRQISHVTVDGSGNVLISGLLTGTLDFGAGPVTSTGTCAASEFCNDAFLAKLDAKGDLVWAHVYGVRDNDFSSVAVTDGAGLYWTGHFGSSIDFGSGVELAGRSGTAFVVRFSSY